jgi:hypothetical protein
MPKTRDSTVYFISEIHNTPLFVRATCSFCSLLPLYLSMFSLASSHLLSSRRRAHSKCGITSVLSVRVPRVRMKRDVPLLTWRSVRWRDNFRYLCVVSNSRVHWLCTQIMTGLKSENPDIFLLRWIVVSNTEDFAQNKCFLKIIIYLFHCCVNSSG